MDDDDDIPAQTDDQETLDDPEDEQVEDEISESDLVVKMTKMMNSMKTRTNSKTKKILKLNFSFN